MSGSSLMRFEITRRRRVVFRQTCASSRPRVYTRLGRLSQDSCGYWTGNLGTTLARHSVHATVRLAIAHSGSTRASLAFPFVHSGVRRRAGVDRHDGVDDPPSSGAVTPSPAPTMPSPTPTPAPAPAPSSGEWTWTVEASGRSEPIVAMWGSSAADVWAVGGHGVVHSRGDGAWATVHEDANEGYGAVIGAGGWISSAARRAPAACARAVCSCAPPTAARPGR